ncbi:hypothetical protein DPMN_090966 [Dreissena polymorpha]|uniref:Uncharacterized protein n=1 Tax=Dreissena polymorpha TaxID=45954 RepID=A0A9D4KYP5_DREPO|nr:hypothetical protein DPMN_090966 [Dreissena polymorpha]
MWLLFRGMVCAGRLSGNNTRAERRGHAASKDEGRLEDHCIAVSRKVECSPCPWGIGWKTLCH